MEGSPVCGVCGILSVGFPQPPRSLPRAPTVGGFGHSGQGPPVRAHGPWGDTDRCYTTIYQSGGLSEFCARRVRYSLCTSLDKYSVFLLHLHRKFLLVDFCDLVRGPSLPLGLPCTADGRTRTSRCSVFSPVPDSLVFTLIDPRSSLRLEDVTHPTESSASKEW